MLLASALSRSLRVHGLLLLSLSYVRSFVIRSVERLPVILKIASRLLSVHLVLEIDLAALDKEALFADLGDSDRPVAVLLPL